MKVETVPLATVPMDVANDFHHGYPGHIRDVVLGDWVSLKGTQVGGRY